MAVPQLNMLSPVGQRRFWRPYWESTWDRRAETFFVIIDEIMCL